ncbi:uncharacterized protein LOC141648396 [Silene latifolia]|uniref:uncharacterized protein LOC141648396 n=1 Tax=Silene latifolia TaxID=37657 RepID=UPI003D76F4C2
MLLDVEAKPELSHGEQRWVDELNEVLYEADDLFDEVITIAKQKELNAGAKFSKKVLDKGFVLNMQPSGAEAGVDIRVPPTADQAAPEQHFADE